MRYQQARSHALISGATQPEIDAEAARQLRHVGTTPFRNMVTVLTATPFHNDRDDWTRLAGALLAIETIRSPQNV